MNVRHNPEYPPSAELQHAETLDLFRAFMQEDTPSAVGGNVYPCRIKAGFVRAPEDDRIDGSVAVVAQSIESENEIYSLQIFQPKSKQLGVHYFFADDPYISSGAHDAVRQILLGIEIDQQYTDTQANILQKYF